MRLNNLKIFKNLGILTNVKFKMDIRKVLNL